MNSPKQLTAKQRPQDSESIMASVLRHNIDLTREVARLRAALRQVIADTRTEKKICDCKSLYMEHYEFCWIKQMTNKIDEVLSR